MSVRGIDVSVHNGAIDWGKVARSGVKFAFIKVTEGDLNDQRAAANARAARRAGVLVGGYSFIRPRPGRTGAQEFDLFYTRAKACRLVSDGCLRPVIDVEATRLDPAGTRAYVASWIARCFDVTGKHPIVYTGQWFWEGKAMRQMTRRYGCKLWLAAYVKNWRKLIPAAWRGHASFWQHTDKGTVPGIHGNVDLNRYLSSMRNLKRSHTL